MVLFADNDDVVDADADDLNGSELASAGYEELTFDPETGVIAQG